MIIDSAALHDCSSLKAKVHLPSTSFFDLLFFNGSKLGREYGRIRKCNHFECFSSILGSEPAKGAVTRTIPLRGLSGDSSERRIQPDVPLDTAKNFKWCSFPLSNAILHGTEFSKLISLPGLGDEISKPVVSGLKCLGVQGGDGRGR